jgi:type III pantothenate kinase
MKEIEVILIDIGNSRIKSCEVIDQEFQNYHVWTSIEELSKAYAHEIPFVISSVRKVPEFSNRQNIFSITHDTSIPIRLNYQTKETLGVDRIVAAVGAATIFPGENVLVIDLGTCMTIDYVEEGLIFQGGIISPGLKMRMQSMSVFTDQLPDISGEWEEITERLPGKSTKECLLGGALQGMVFEINSAIRHFTEKFTSINVILTGGDAQYFESRINTPIFAGLKIVETGLYRIWKHQ